MTERAAADWSNYWQGRTAGESGEALAGARIERDPALSGFWAGVFAEASPDARIIDLACGAGSALRAAKAAGLSNLTGVDVSEGAILALNTALPGVRGLVASAANTRLEDGGFDIVVSQFGFEYAGAKPAALEAIRLAAPGARFAAIAHMADSPIALECRSNLERTRAIETTGFVAAARHLFEAIFSGNAARTQQAAQAFRSVEATLARLCQDDAAHRNGLAGHLYAGTKQLYQRRSAYILSDITSWLDSMSGEIEAYAGRMTSMLDAALSETAARNLLDVFAAAGWQADAPQPFSLDDDSKPVAWQLHARAPK